MPGAVISEQELANAEKLRGRGDLTTALRLTQEMLSRAEDDGTRMRLLFDLLDCSTQLRLDEITRHAIAELERLPEPKISQLIVDLIKAISLIEHGEVAKGLELTLSPARYQTQTPTKLPFNSNGFAFWTTCRSSHSTNWPTCRCTFFETEN